MNTVSISIDGSVCGGLLANYIMQQGEHLPPLRWHGSVLAKLKVNKNANLGYSHDRVLS